MIVGFGIRSISAERRNIPRGRIDINSTPRLVGITKAKTGLFKKERPLNVEFEFVTKYEPGVGEIKIKGNVFYMSKNLKDVLNVWERSKTFPKEVDIEVKNFLFRKCLTIGINLAENMQLPPPLMFPVTIPRQKETPKKEDLKYIG